MGEPYTETGSDLVAHLLTLPRGERVALVRAMLRADPDAAVEAVDTAKVARAWVYGRSYVYRAPLALGSDDLHRVRAVSAGFCADYRRMFATRDEAIAWCDYDLVRIGWVLAGVPRG